MKRKRSECFRRKKPTALLVDDDLDLLDALTALFKKHEFLVRQASTTAHAANMLEDAAYDVVVIDVRMPESPNSAPKHDAGVVLAELIRSLGLASHHAVVVVFTAFPTVRDMFAAVSAGVFYFPKTLPKLNAAAQLVEECKRMVELRRRSRELRPSWFDEHFDDLVSAFAGRTVAVFKPGELPERAIRGESTIVGGRTVITASSETVLRKRILKSADLCRATPVLLSIPTQLEV